MTVAPPQLTVVVNLHREGHLARVALRSALVAAEAAGRRGVACRLVAVVDRGDEATRAGVSRFRHRLDALSEVDFGDLGRSRNHGIALVRTKYLALLDGDDLFDRDWLWKGVEFLEGLGDGRTVAHAAVRLSFGAEQHGRVQVGSDSPHFHPLNLATAWHYAADVIGPAELFRGLPFVAADRERRLGAEDWHWTCESLVEGIRHRVVPGTAYFYRRLPGHVSLGALRGFTYPPTRLLDGAAVAALDAASPSAAIRFGDRVTAPEGGRERWAGLPLWLEKSLEHACGLELELYDLHERRGTVPLETPPFAPAAGHFFLRLMAQFGTAPLRVVFFCDRLAPEALQVIEDFLARHRQRREPGLDVLVVALAHPEGAAPPGEAAPGPDAAGMRLRHLDLGAEPAFGSLWVGVQHALLVRFLLQARPALVVNLDCGFFDALAADFGPAIAGGGTRTVRVCGARHPVDDAEAFLADWAGLVRAEGNYSLALCRCAAVAERLDGYFRGSGLRALHDGSGTEPGDGRSTGSLLHDLLSERGPAGPAAVHEEPARAAAPAPGAPDVTVVIVAGSEGCYLNPTLRALAAAAASAEEQGLCLEVVAVAGRPGPRTRRVLAALPGIIPGARVIETGVDDEGAVVNAGVAAARAGHVAVMPAGDLVSPGWLARALLRSREAGAEAVVHPHALVACGSRPIVDVQPDMEDPACELADLAFHETWTAHALAPRELFLRFPYRSTPAGSGYGHATWHWNCETVAQGCRHLTVPETAVYRRIGSPSGESVQRLGAAGDVTLPPSSFFSAHAWLEKGAMPPAGPWRTPPAGWDDAAYLRANPDVARAVGAGTFPSGYAHYRLHGRGERRVPAGKDAAAPARPPGPRPGRPRVARAAPPADWDDGAYLRGKPDVAAAVAAGAFPSGYAHYCLHGRSEGSEPAWSAGGAAGGPAARPSTAPALRLPTPPAWLRRGLSVCPPGLYRLLAGTGRHPPPPAFPLPRWLDEDLRALSGAEPGLDPRRLGVPRPAPPRDLRAAGAYRECRQAVAAARPTHILLAPALQPGGAGRALEHCVGALLEEPDNRVLVVTTDCRDDRWSGRLPRRCAWLRFPEVAEGLQEQRAEVLARVLTNAGARVLHLFHSWLGWEVLRRHAPALAAHMRLFVSIFSVPPVGAGLGAGYARYLGPLLPHLAGILTDNRRAAAALEEVCGVPRERVAVLRHPAEAATRFAGPAADSNVVLWAGRIDWDKRPKLLRDVARRLPGLRFHVYGTPVLNDDAELARLRAVPNIDCRGPFAGFDTIPAAPYRCFLHTSRWDGTPNVVLEAMLAGLLVVAPDVGGIGEVVTGDTGLLVREVDDPGAYAAAIERTLRDDAAWRRVAESGRRRVAATYTGAAFRDALRAVPGYLT